MPMNSSPDNLQILVVGGHSRSVGKTSLVTDIIRAFPEAGWTAIKVTQYGHGVCSVNGESCSCAPAEHAFALDEDRDPASGTDTARFLAAGAFRSLWLRAKQGRLAEALPLLCQAFAPGGNIIIESNSVLLFVRPVLFLMALDPRIPDFKPSANSALNHADAFILRSPISHPAWQDVSPFWFPRRPQFSQPLGAPLPPDLVEFVRTRFFSSPSSHSSISS
jgi:molybdopterin-guanine dinucleotide biosynthesis protein